MLSYDLAMDLHSPGPELTERNRELLAARGNWPPGALEACRDLEHRHPGWHAWWTDRPWRRDGDVPDGPAYGAAPVSRPPVGHSLYAVTADELAGLIGKADEERAALRWR